MAKFKFLSTLLLAAVSLTACSASGRMVAPPSAAFNPQFSSSNFQRMSAPAFRAQSSAVDLNTYYQNAQGKQGQALLSSLHHIVAKHKDLGYSGARDVMFSTIDDSDNDDVVRGVYTGKMLPGVNDRRTAYRDGAGFNTEHTWPKSKGAKSEPAKSDLHHLFPTDIKTNGMRSSYPFGVVTRVQYQNGGSKLGIDARGRTVFEPRDDHKGDLARALFYFYTVYGRSGSTSLSNFSYEEPVLHQWHKMDPVSATEKARNEAIFKYQHNRNPFVDHPEYVDQIGRFHG